LFPPLQELSIEVLEAKILVGIFPEKNPFKYISKHYNLYLISIRNLGALYFKNKALNKKPKKFKLVMV